MPCDFCDTLGFRLYDDVRFCAWHWFLLRMWFIGQGAVGRRN